MGMTKKTKQQLIEELEALRTYVAELERVGGKRTRAEEQLCKWDYVFEDAGWGIVIANADGKIIETMNPAFAQMHGYTIRELTGHLIADIFAPESRAELPVQIQLAGERGHYDFEAVHIRKDNSTFPVMMHVTTVKDEHGHIRYRVMHAEDISECKREENMRRTQRRLVILLSAASDLSERLGYLLEAACQIEGIDCGSIFVADKHTGAFDMVSNRGLSTEFVKGSFHHNASTEMARIARSGWSSYWSAQDTVPEEQETYRQHERLRAMAMIPVLHGGRAVAVFCPASRTHDAITATARQALTAIAAQIGDAIDRARQQAAILENQRNLQSLFDAMDDLLFVLGSDGKILRINPALRKRLGYFGTELVGSLVFKIYPPEQREVIATLLADMTAGNTSASYVPLITKKGNLIPVETRIVQGMWDNHDALICISRDITERRQAEEIVHLRRRLWDYAAKHSLAELMQKALDEIGELTASPIGFYNFVEADQNTISLQAWSTRTLQEFCQADGKGLHYNVDEAGVWADCIREQKPVIHNDYATLSHRKGMPDGHAEIVRELVVPAIRDGRVVSILGVGNKPSDYDKKDVEFVSYVADIVWSIIAHKRADEMIQQSNAELDAFGHAVAHDLKDPLSNLISYINLMEDKDAPPTSQEMRQLTQGIRQMSTKMDNIVDELMLLAELRKAEVEIKPLNTAYIVTHCLERLTQLIEESHTLIIRPASWPQARGHGPWVEEVWMNYISNAIKYGGRPPQVELGASQEDGSIRFWVRDNGGGLTPGAQSRLFTPFERLSQTRASGHGLGLSIVRGIVERMGGQVSVMSEGIPGEGSVFSFTLPAAQ
jgi:PAS domain S-box-containing protein